jgi:hypothetical protein
MVQKHFARASQIIWLIDIHLELRFRHSVGITAHQGEEKVMDCQKGENDALFG